MFWVINLLDAKVCRIDDTRVMPIKLSFSDYLAVVGIILTIVFIVLDKAGKLRGPMLLLLLAVAALLTLPLLLNIDWVAEAQGTAKFSRILLTLCAVGVVYSLLAVWVSPNTVTVIGTRDGRDGHLIASAADPAPNSSAFPSSTPPATTSPQPPSSPAASQPTAQLVSPTPSSSPSPKEQSADDVELKATPLQVYVFPNAVPPPRERMAVVMYVHIANNGSVATRVQKFDLKFFYFNDEHPADQLPCNFFRVTKVIDGKPVTEVLTNDLQSNVGKSLARQDPWDGWLCFEAGDVPVFRADAQNVITRIELQLDIKDGADQLHSTRFKYPFQRPWNVEKFRF
jgi:hypothetical protein